MIERREAEPQSQIGNLGSRADIRDMFARLADELDAKQLEVRQLVEPVRLAAELMLSEGDRKTAATLFGFIERKYRLAMVTHVANYYARRAKECRARRRTGK